MPIISMAKMIHEERPKFNTDHENLDFDGSLCDAVLRVQDVEFNIHKVILCKCIPYFRALFLRWSSPNQRVYDVSGIFAISPEIMELIIKYAYTGYLPVTLENVLDLLHMADQLNITELIQSCSSFLEEQLRPDNCIIIWRWTSFIYSPKLHLKAYHYILDHFQEIILYDEFLDLTLEELADFLGRDKLSVRKESTVFEVILRWIAHMPQQRKEHLPTLLSKVRLCLMSMEYIKINVLSNDLVRNNFKCLAMVTETSRIMCHFLTDHAYTGLCNPFVRPRLPTAIVLATGGWGGGDPIDDIEAYDIRVNRWIKVTPSADQLRAYHGTAFLGGYVYYIGGFNRLEYFNSVTRFDPVTRIWQEVSPMHWRRCYISVTVLNGSIYALGGFDGNMRLSSAEYYQPEINQWRRIAHMQQQRSDASCTTLQEKVYIFGGNNGRTCLQTAEYYNPVTNQWTMISDMSSRRRGVGVVAYRDYIYVIGGCNGEDRLFSAEVYNPKTNNWNNLAPMMTSRSNFGIAVIEDHIIVVGGFDGFRVTSAVESYDVVLNEWSEARDMEISRSALSCCVVYGLPNMHEYTFNRDSLPLCQLDHGENEEEVEEEREEEGGD